MTTPSPRYVRRDAPELARYGYTARKVRRAQSDGRLSTFKPSGPTGPALVDLSEVRRLVRGTCTGPTTGPLAGGGGDLDALIGRYRETGDPAAQSALVAIAQKVDSALWGDV